MQRWHDTRWIVVVFVLVAVVASLKEYMREPHPFRNGTAFPYNNYRIYSNSARHLAQGEDLYQEYLHEHWDFFLYSPTCAALFTPFASMPDFVGLCLWNGLNAALLAYAMRKLPGSSQMTACMAWLALKDLLTNLQNSQANGLIAALMILTFACWQRERLAQAAFCLALAAFIKPFALAAGIFWIIYDRRLRFIGWFAGSVALLAALPLAVTSPARLMEQYQSWFARLEVMHGLSAGDSVMGILETWFGMGDHRMSVVAVGLVLQLLPLVRRSQWSAPLFPLSVLASTLIWVVIFNHEAESPTFVIAAAGISIWFCSQPITRWRLALGIFALVLTSFSSSDLFPNFVQEQYIAPYHLKALPCVVIWIQLQAELLTRRYTDLPKEREESQERGEPQQPAHNHLAQAA